MHRKYLTLMTGLCLLLNGSLLAADGTPSPTPAIPLRELTATLVKQKDASWLKDYGGRPDFLIKPGLLADRTGRVVRVAAESIRLKPGDPVEFSLITRDSGKDYEALAVSFASARDIHEALQFIGLHPGHCTDQSRLQFWPKGDRVRMTFHYTDTPNVRLRHIPTERLVIDTRTSRQLPESGFVFTGSEWAPVMEPATGKVYAADAFSPGAIVSLYNDSFTVLDVPRRASQNEVYTFQVPNPDFLLPSNQLIEVTFEPYHTDTRSHRLDLTLFAAPAVDTRANTNLTYTLKDTQGTLINTNHTVNGLLAALERLSPGGDEIFATLYPEDTTPLILMQTLARLVNTLDNEQGIHVEAPPPGHPYFRAFLPNEKHRLRENRPSIAAELHLASGGATNSLVWLNPEWKNDDKPVFHETTVAVVSPAALDAAITARGDAPTVMLIYAPGTISYGTLREFAAPLLKKTMILYVFVD